VKLRESMRTFLTLTKQEANKEAKHV
jgi:hypothetical protein